MPSYDQILSLFFVVFAILSSLFSINHLMMLSMRFCLNSITIILLNLCCLLFVLNYFYLQVMLYDFVKNFDHLFWWVSMP